MIITLILNYLVKYISYYKIKSEKGKILPENCQISY